MALKAKVNSSKASPPIINHRTIVGRNRRNKTEARIIEAALHVFAKRGADAPVIDDFIKAAGIARGTFYNYFSNTDELLFATSTWLTDDMTRSIENEIKLIKDPVVRHGVGLRLWMRKARLDTAWCGFVSTVWFQGGFASEAPLRDIRLGIKAKKMSCPSAECGWDMTLGTMRQAMIRLLKEPKLAKTDYADQIIDIILQGLGVSTQLRQQILAYQLPEVRISPKTVF